MKNKWANLFKVMLNKKEKKINLKQVLKLIRSKKLTRHKKILKHGFFNSIGGIF